MQNHTHCAKLNRVPFPLYDALAVVYGKGRATGKTAVGLEELNQSCPPIDDSENLMLNWIDTEEVNDQPKVETRKTTPTIARPLHQWLKSIHQQSLMRRRHRLRHLVNLR
ncbi:hypothetical protein LINPERHAP1_LOCUS4089 [Linum perenne]